MNKPFLLLLAAFGLAACSTNDEPAPQQRTLSIRVSEKATRTASATTTEALSAFSMNYQDNQYDFLKTGGEWNTKTWPSEPENNEKIGFYAYDGGELNWSNSEAYTYPYVSFNTGTDAFAQHDLLVAADTVAYSDHGGIVSLEFVHACAAVRFTIQKHADVGEKVVTVTHVELKGVLRHGEYHYADSTWQDLSAAQNYVLTDDSPIRLSTEKQPLPCQYLFLIPQPKEGIELSVDFRVDGVEKQHTFSLGGIWKAGHEYPININLGSAIIDKE